MVNLKQAKRLKESGFPQDIETMGAVQDVKEHGDDGPIWYAMPRCEEMMVFLQKNHLASIFPRVIGTKWGWKIEFCNSIMAISNTDLTAALVEACCRVGEAKKEGLK